MSKRQNLIRFFTLIFIVLPHSALASENDYGEWTRAYCGKSGSAVLIFIDRTTAYDAIDSQILDESLYASVSQARPGERVIIRTITDTPFGSKRIFDGCRPGCEKNDWGSWLTCNSIGSKPLVDRFHRSAAKSVESVRNEDEVYPQSSLFSTISVVTQEYRDANLGRVIIVSDGHENSAEISSQSILKGSPNAVLKRLRALKLSPRVPGAEVIVVGVGRSDASARPGLSVSEFRNLQSIWTQWFIEGGAKCAEVYQWLPTDPCRTPSVVSDLNATE